MPVRKMQEVYPVYSTLVNMPALLNTSPKAHFSVLIYMHRYHADTLNNILNLYLREFMEKLQSAIEQNKQLETTGSASEKARALREIDRLTAVLTDCQTYERDILYPLAAERIRIGLDEGVLVNYNHFGTAIEKVPGLNDPNTKKKVKGFDWIDGERVG